MSENLIRRNIESLLIETLSDTPAAVIQGARQVGKSTLVSMIATGLDCRQLTLDDPELLLAAQTDPVGFANQYPEGTLILDEVQLCPNLLRPIKLSIDQNRRPGRFILTGSADLLRISGANESLAGRAETIKLFPFSRGELAGVKEDFVTGLLDADENPGAFLRSSPPMERKDYIPIVAKGGFPEIARRKNARQDRYFRNYVSGILDHDAAVISNLSHLDKLTNLFAVLSADTSGIFVQTNVSRQIGIPDSSMNGYIKLLKDLHLINVLPAWGRNIAKRAIGKPKISIMDTGIACYLNGAKEPFLADITGGEALGSLLESFVVNELFKQQSWSETEYSLFHYHDRERREIDIIIELFDGRIIALEVKSARSISRKDFQGMGYIRELLGSRFLCGIVLYTGSEVQRYGDRIFSAPICTLWQI